MKKVISFLLIAVGTSLLLSVIVIVSQHNVRQEKNLIQAIELTKETKTTPKFNPFEGELIGVLKIPSLAKELPIIEGTGKTQLKEGVGHYPGTAFPGDNNQIVLSGHRDTVFRGFDKLQAGDEIIISLSYGSFTYIVMETKIVPATDRTVIRTTFPQEELILTTCYPFGYIGTTSKRFIVYAYPE